MSIKRFANSHDYHKRVKRRKPFISATNTEKRKEWAEKTIGQDWSQLIFTAESAIEMGEAVRKEFTTRRPGEEYNYQHIQSSFHCQRKSLMVWAAIAHGKKWPLNRLPLAPGRVVNGKRTRAEGLNAQKYWEWIITGQLKPFLRRAGVRWT